MSNNLDPDQDQHSVRPDLSPKTVCKGYEQTTKVTASKERVKLIQQVVIYLGLYSSYNSSADNSQNKSFIYLINAPFLFMVMAIFRLKHCQNMKQSFFFVLTLL